MIIKYRDEEFDLKGSPKTAKEISSFLHRNEQLVNSGDFSTLIQKCNFSLRSYLIKLLYLGGMTSLFTNYIFQDSFAESDILEIKIPKQIQVIEPYAFDMSTLWKVSFEENCELAIIQSGAFTETDIEEFRCPSGLMHLDSEVFKGCSAIKRFYLNKDNQSIGSKCFDGCNQLKEIYYNGTIEDSEDIDFDAEWLVNSEIKKIICQDGVIEIPKWGD